MLAIEAVCSRCGDTKPLASFSKDRRRPQGVGRTCAECKKAAKAAYRATPRGALLGVLRGMIRRCTDRKFRDYHCYGGRGISVYHGWVVDPDTFVEFAIAKGWAPGLDADRIDPNGNYEPSNVRFITKSLNLRNRRPSPHKRSRFRGVVPSRHAGRWEAHIWVNGRNRYLGAFVTEEAAARAYDDEARKHEGFPVNFQHADC